MTRTVSTARFSMIAAAALAASSLAVITAPAAIAAATQATVTYGDLDLTTEAGRATLDARITRAARIACSSQIETGTILRGRANPECVAAARAQIERQVAVRTASSKLGG